MIFKTLSVAKNCLRPESMPLRSFIYSKKRCKRGSGTDPLGKSQFMLVRPEW